MPFKTGMNEPALIEQAEVLFGRQERTVFSGMLRIPVAASHVL